MRESFAYIELEGELDSIEEAVKIYKAAQALLKAEASKDNNNDF